MKIRTAARIDNVRRTLIRRIFDSAPPDAINLGLGQPDLPTPAVAAVAGIAAVAQGRTGYTSTAGDPDLRRSIAASLTPFVTGPEGVLVTVGSQEAMFAACLALLDPGDELMVPDPGYPAYPVVARLVGAHPVPYPLRRERRFRLDPEDVERRLTAKTRAVILCAPSNPTGACIDREDLDRLTSLLDRRGVPWLSDEIYSGFSYGERFLSPSAVQPDGGLVISGLSKDMSMTGWRIGWVAGPEEVISKVIATHQYLVTCASSVSQRAALAAFTPEGLVERERALEIFRRRRALMADELSSIPGIRFDAPDGAFYFFVDVSSHGDSLGLAQRILDRRGVITIPGEAFGENGAGNLRISFAAPEATISDGIRRIAQELRESRP